MQPPAVDLAAMNHHRFQKKEPQARPIKMAKNVPPKPLAGGKKPASFNDNVGSNIDNNQIEVVSYRYLQ